MAAITTKFACKVVGHEIVVKQGIELLKVKLKGTDFSGLKVELVVDSADRGKYPFGSAAVVDFAVQQSLPLER